MSVPQDFWSKLIEINKHVDALVDKVTQAIEPSQPIGREIPFYASLECLFDNLPTRFQTTPAQNSDLLAGNNIKRAVFENGGSRVYIRELGFERAICRDPVTNNPQMERIPDFGRFPIYFRWNLETSITNRQYANFPVSMLSAGNPRAGNHLAFREPFVVEPRESLIFTCELLAFGMTQNAAFAAWDECIISLIASGYREGV